MVVDIGVRDLFIFMGGGGEGAQFLFCPFARITNPCPNPRQLWKSRSARQKKGKRKKVLPVIARQCPNFTRISPKFHPNLVHWETVPPPPPPPPPAPSRLVRLYIVVEPHVTFLVMNQNFQKAPNWRSSCIMTNKKLNDFGTILWKHNFIFVQ